MGVLGCSDTRGGRSRNADFANMHSCKQPNLFGAPTGSLDPSTSEVGWMRSEQLANIAGKLSYVLPCNVQDGNAVIVPKKVMLLLSLEHGMVHLD